jgi:dienelactone hydrolase
MRAFRKTAVGCLAAAMVVGGTLPAANATSAATTPTLPRPSGPYHVGVEDVYLVDHSRPDPWKPPQSYRELMISVVYPARADVAAYGEAQLMTSGVSDGFNALAAPGNYGIPGEVKVDWSAIRTYEHVGAPVASGRHPVVLYSPGAGDVRSWDSVLVDQLASEGYVVVTIDPTYEASAVQFPDKRIVPSNLLTWYAKAQQSGTVPQFLKEVVDTRVADTEFVLNSLGTLPDGLSDSVDVKRVGMFGHSAGGFTALSAMYEDHRIRAGIDMDGTLEYTAGDPSDANFSAVAEHGLTSPFLLLGSDSRDACTAATDPSCAAVLQHSTGWHGAITLPGTGHGSFTDAETLIPQLAAENPTIPRSAVTGDVGTADPRAVTAVVETIVSGFFGAALR